MDDTLLHRVLRIDEGNAFCRFANADGKVWVMPVQNMRTAMNLYQPSGVKGKLLKRWFPALSWSRIVRRAIHAERVNCVLRTDLRELLAQVLGVDDFEFSVFGGTPCVHQKITIQLSRGEQILGYCKLSDHADIIKLFHRETDVLSLLAQRGLNDCVPQALYCGELNDGVGVFVQSTIKTNHSWVEHEWTVLQEDFLARLQQATQQRLPFEESDYFRTLMDLQEHLDWLPEQVDRMLIVQAIKEVLSVYAGQEVEFSAYHADFTPWNMFVEDGRLFVFDFEYAQMTYPAGLDCYHFFLQTAHFERHWSATEVLDYMQSSAGAWVDKELLKLYLLDVISRFTMREGGRVEGDVAHSMDLWITILDRIS